MINGNVPEIRLRCEKQYLTFRYAPDLEYKIERPVGSCAIEVVGEYGTAFEVIES